MFVYTFANQKGENISAKNYNNNVFSVLINMVVYKQGRRLRNDKQEFW